MNVNFKETSTTKNYKTPTKKLMSFFKKSRDKWKEKCKDSKYQVKLLRKKINYIEQNKIQIYKERLAELEKKLDQSKYKEDLMQQEINQLKKKKPG